MGLVTARLRCAATGSEQQHAWGYASLEDFVERSYVGGFANDEPHNLLAMLALWDAGDASANPVFEGDLHAALAAVGDGLRQRRAMDEKAAKAAAKAEAEAAGEHAPLFPTDNRRGRLLQRGVRALVMPCATDRYFEVPESWVEAELLNHGVFEDGDLSWTPPRREVASLVPIPSTWGHRAGDPSRPGQRKQAAFVASHIRDLLLEK